MCQAQRPVGQQKHAEEQRERWADAAGERADRDDRAKQEGANAEVSLAVHLRIVPENGADRIAPRLPITAMRRGNLAG